jgi:two-component system cell cycle sensor histidine kinase/response regulator CckA
MVYGIVKQMGGSISLYSESGHGTSFRIYLPRCGEAMKDGVREAEPAVEEASRSGLTRGTETIMLVEDNPMVRKLAESLLRKAGYRVHAASGAAECLKTLDGHTGPLHLLLTDVIMPNMNGKDLFHRAVALFPGLKVLYMSGYTADVIAHQGILDEGVNLIQKPFTVRALTEKVRGVLDAL